jgi:small neutral amino acid transporter SnatA (MarC family)
MEFRRQGACDRGTTALERLMGLVLVPVAVDMLTNDVAQLLRYRPV